MTKLGPAKPSMPRFVPTVTAPVFKTSRIRAKGIGPPQKELPAGMNAPVQPCAGIHTSNFTSELNIRVEATTRQNAGRSENGAAAVAPPGRGGVNAPAATDCAEVIVVSGSAVAASRSQGDDAGARCASAAPGVTARAT